MIQLLSHLLIQSSPSPTLSFTEYLPHVLLQFIAKSTTHLFNHLLHYPLDRPFNHSLNHSFTQSDVHSLSLTLSIIYRFTNTYTFIGTHDRFSCLCQIERDLRDYPLQSNSVENIAGDLNPLPGGIYTKLINIENEIKINLC